MGNVSLPIGSTNSGTNDWSDVHGEDQAIVDVVNGNIENANIKAGAAIAASKLAIPLDSGIVTSLPASPATGDTCTYTDSLTAPTYYWQLMYNGADRGSYKWAVVGGPQRV